MKSLNTYINSYIIEGGFFKNVKDDIVIPKSKEELIEIIKDAIVKEGPNCDLNFIDVLNINDLSNIFANSIFNCDISNWNVSNAKNMSCMFCNSSFNGDISKWNIQKHADTTKMFYNCPVAKRKGRGFRFW